jgi:hypothetical protein
MSVKLVLLCEDKQHEAFARRFLEKAGWEKRRMRVVRAPSGSAEQFVRTQYPIELSAYRSNRGRVAEALVVVIDGDTRGVDARIAQLNQACAEKQIDPRNSDDRVAIIVPTRNIETWLAYLRGEVVNEVKADYPKLTRERECNAQVALLYEMCQRGALRQPSPPSLDAACEEYRTRMHP